MEEHRMTLVLFLLSILHNLVFSLPLEGSRTRPCSASGIAVYKLTFQTFWSRDSFSKQYPTYRPHAQWSRVIGRTHSADYLLWREGELASVGVKQFAEEGSSLNLEQESQGHHGVYDIFSSPSIDSGVGKASSLIFLDSKHHLVSLMSHLIPSPDWFVGMDSVSLCSDNQWEDKKYISLKIWDAGTDKGFTFTSPNWPEVPAKAIEQITASYPSHPASSFFYHHTRELPEIARVILTRDSVAENALLQQDWSARKGEHLSSAPEVNQLEMDKSGDPSKPESSHASVTAPRGEHVNHETHMAPPSGPVGKKETTVREEAVTDATPAPKKSRKRKLTKEERLRRKKEREERRERKQRERQARKSKSKQASSRKQQTQTDIDCQVSDWQEWSPCSKSCGYGSQTRMRTVLVAVSGRGVACPPLTEDQMCGTMRGCGWTHFNSNNWGTVLK